jgi:hypothetical protein
MPVKNKLEDNEASLMNKKGKKPDVGRGGSSRMMDINKVAKQESLGLQQI